MGNCEFKLDCCNSGYCADGIAEISLTYPESRRLVKIWLEKERGLKIITETVECIKSAISEEQRNSYGTSCFKPYLKSKDEMRKHLAEFPAVDEVEFVYA